MNFQLGLVRVLALLIWTMSHQLGAGLSEKLCVLGGRITHSPFGILQPFVLCFLRENERMRIAWQMAMQITSGRRPTLYMIAKYASMRRKISVGHPANPLRMLVARLVLDALSKDLERGPSSSAGQPPLSPVPLQPPRP
jgi:hypothetical protein